MCRSFFRWNKFLYFITKEDHTYFIIVIDCRESKNRCNFCHLFFFQLRKGAESIRTTDIDQQHYSEFAFFFKNLDEGVIEPCSDIPVNIPDIVTILVFAHLAECHSFSFKGAMILSRKNLT